LYLQQRNEVKVLDVLLADQSKYAIEESVVCPEGCQSSRTIPFEALLPFINESFKLENETLGEALDALDAQLSSREAMVRRQLFQSRSDVACQRLEVELENIEIARCRIAQQLDNELFDYSDY
jgi:hypothetical protein